MKNKIKILYLEDCATDAELVTRHLKKSNLAFDLRLVDEREEFEEGLRNFQPHIVLSDHSLPAFNSFEALKIVRASGMNIPFVLVTAALSEEFAVEAIKQGMDDYIVKDRMQRLPKAILGVMEKFKLESDKKELLLVAKGQEKETNETLRRNEEKFRLISTNSPDFISIQDAQLRYEWVVKGLPGIAAEEMIGKVDSDLLTDQQSADLLRVKQQVLITGEESETTYNYTAPDGSLHFYKARIVPRRSATGILNGILSYFKDITQHVRSEQEIKANEARYRDLFENSHDGIILATTKGNVLRANTAACTMFGFTEQELVALVTKDLLAADVDFFTGIHVAGKSHPKIEKELLFKKKDQSSFAGELCATVFKDSNGQDLLSFIIRDITERKRAEKEIKDNYKELQNSFQQQKSLLDALPANIALLDENGVVVGVNYRWEKFARENGYEGNDFAVGQNYLDVCGFSPEDPNSAKTKEGIKKILEGEINEFSLEYPCHSPHEKRWFQLIVVAMVFQGNRRAVVSHLNVTERVMAQKGLVESHERYEHALSTTNDVIWEWNFEGDVVFRSDAYEKIFGYAKHGNNSIKTAMSKVHEKDRVRVYKSLLTMIRNKDTGHWNESYKYIKADGTIAIVQDRGSLLFDGTGKPVRFIGALQDRTEKVILEEKLMHYKVQKQKDITKVALQVQEKEKNFLGGELHDNVNQILTALKLKLHLLGDSPQVNKVLLKDCISNLLYATDEIRLLSKRLVTHRFDEDSLTEALLFMFDGMSVQKQVEFYAARFQEHKVDEGIKLTLYRVVQEQLNNIVKYAKADRICILLQNDDDNVYLNISDNGVGFSLKQKRTGVGLTNIYNRVESFNGTINIYSTPGNGCRIEIAIPLNQYDFSEVELNNKGIE